MNPQFDHNLISSFCLWIDDVLVNSNGCLETGKSQNFTFSSADPDIPSNMVAYYSSDRQFSPYDSDSGVYVNGVFVLENQTVGPIIDYDKGRVLFSSGSGESLLVSGNFDRKEFNVYLSNEDEEFIIYNKEFNIANTNQSYFETITGAGVARYTIPAIFVINQDSTVEPFAMGGEKETVSTIRCVIIADNNYAFEGVKAILRDQKFKVFKTFSYQNYPFGRFSAIKSRPYNYSDFINSQTGTLLSDIKDVKVSNLDDVVNRKIGLPANIKVGFADIKICTYRGNF